jgi:hypothetical protein
MHPDRPLPQLDSPLAHAVAASDLRGAGREMFALVCRPDLMPRIDFIPQISRLDRLPFVSPVDAGTVGWPETGGRRFVIVFDINFGQRICEPSDKTITPMREDQLTRTVIKPLMPVLKELIGRHIPHRAIRADNLFYTDASRQAVVLGECVSAPPGISQPVLYEPIDSAIASPSARGLGTVADDLYAFGALLAFLLTGGQAVRGMSDEEIVEAKIALGSYSALIDQARVSLGMMEPLRGLLCDDLKERWTFSDLELWLGGRKLSPKQPMLPTRAARSIAVAGKEYWTKLSLYHAMGVHWSEADQLVVSGQLEKWVRRALSDDETSEALRGVTGTAKVVPDNVGCLTTKTLIVLEPTMPLRYQNLAARIDGLTDAFAIDFHDQEFRQTFTDLVRSKLPQTYLQSQVGTRPDQVALMKTYDMINFFLDRPQMGHGLERALYEINRGWPCQSPLIQDHCVYEIQDLLPALERVVERGELTQEIVDPHIAAFCAARLRKLPERVLRELDRHDDLAAFRLGTLRLFAEVQRESSPKQRCPALCGWMARSVQPIVDSYHNRAYRRRLAEEIERASGKGDLLELLFLLDSFEARSQDNEGFKRARNEYADHARAIAWLQEGGLTSAANVRFKSQQAATLISATLSAMTILALSLIYVI